MCSRPRKPHLKPEPKSLGGLRLVEERRVVEFELLQGVAKDGIVLAVDGEQPAEHHRRDLPVAGQRPPPPDGRRW